MRCPVCEYENSSNASHCESCDQILTTYDRPEAVEKYQRAFDKLTVEGTLAERGAQQCKKLRSKLHISEAFHEQLVAQLSSSDESEEQELTLALSWSSDHQVNVALIHGGDFTFEQVDISVLSTLSTGIHRERIDDIDPDERHLFQVPLYDLQAQPPSLLAVAVQIQVRTIDITEEVCCYRTPLLALTSGELELIDLEGQPARSLYDLLERRALFSLLGSEGWRALPLQRISEDELFQWEVQVTAKRDWLRRSAADGWRVGDQYRSQLGDLSFDERLCPGGISWVGAPLGVGRDWETPAHQVKITGPLWCTETLVTQALWYEIMGVNPSAFMTETAPVDSISWYDAIHFCNRLSRRLGLSPVYRISNDRKVSRDSSASGFRLPSEVEWEHLAKGGLDRTYAGSNRPDQVCWSLENSHHQSHPVAEKTPNAWGLFDCCGNVWEWCEDYFIDDVYRKRASLLTDPRVLFPPQVTSQPSRVRRGGSWATAVNACRVFSRADGQPNWKSPFVGLRVIRVERRGVSPTDRRIGSADATWAHLQQGPVYLAIVASSPRRHWAIRLESLGVTITDHEEHAGVVIILPPRTQRPTKSVWDQLDQARRRAHGIGALVLEVDRAAELLEAREADVHQTEGSGARWAELYGKRVLVVGRFRLTQKGLIERLSTRGILITIDPNKAEVLIAGGGKLSAKRQLEFSARELSILNEVECLAILDAQPAIPLS